MRILFINNDGAGFADHVDVNPNTSVAAFFDERCPSSDPSNYLIRVNRQPCASGQVLQDGDRVSFTPSKIEGAICVGVTASLRL